MPISGAKRKWTERESSWPDNVRRKQSNMRTAKKEQSKTSSSYEKKRARKTKNPKNRDS